MKGGFLEERLGVAGGKGDGGGVKARAEGNRLERGRGGSGGYRGRRELNHGEGR